MLQGMTDDFLLSTGEVATRLGVTASRVRQLDDRLMPVVRPNGQRRYSVARVAELIEKRSAR